MKTAVIILNWNGLGFLQQYLPQLEQCTEKTDTMLVVADNGSTDASAAYVAEAHPGVKWIQFDRNYGFADGYNRAISLVDARYVVLLNSDVEVTPGWLEPLINRLESDPRTAAVMPKLHAVNHRTRFEYAGAAGGFLDRWGYAFCRGRLFDAVEEDTGQYDTPGEIFWATGACMAVRRDVYLEAGGLDAYFFAHMEEIDLCWRLKNAGFSVWYEPASTVCHVGGGTLPQQNPFKTYLNYRNNLLMLYKNLPDGQVWPTLGVRLLLDGVSACQALLKPGGRAVMKAVLKAHRAFWKALPHYREQLREKPRANAWPSCVYRRSVVFAYFLRGRKHYSDL